jgi:hypothetical protein
MATQIRSEYWATATQIRSEYWATVFLLAVGCGANASPDASEGDLNVSTAKSAAQALSELCPSTGTPTPVGAVTGRQLSEVSGLVASLTNPGLFYVHNDSGGSAAGLCCEQVSCGALGFISRARRFRLAFTETLGKPEMVQARSRHAR